MQYNRLSLIMLVALAATPSAIFADGGDATIKAAQAKLKALHETREKLHSEIKDGAPTEAQFGELENLNALQKNLNNFLESAKYEAHMNALPEHERFATELGNFDKEQRKTFDKLNLVEVVRASLDRSADNGMVRELSQEGKTELLKAQAGGNIGGICLPADAVRHLKARLALHMYSNATQSVTGSNLGSQFVPTQTRVDLAQLSSLLPTPVVQRAGATILGGLTGNITVPKIAPTGTFNVVAENANATAVDHATTSVTMQPWRLPAYCDISDMLAIQSSADVEAWILRLMLDRLAVRTDEYALTGTGSSQPRGLNATSGIGSITPATNGQAPTWAHIVELESKVGNANSAGNVYVTNTKVRGKLKQTQLAANLPFVWSQDGSLNGYRTEVSNVVSSTLTQGTASGICSEIIFGDFSSMVLGEWGGLMIENVRDKAGAIAGQGTVLITKFMDAAVLQPAAFAVMLDALTA